MKLLSRMIDHWERGDAVYKTWIAIAGVFIHSSEE
jgi:hypothetical protein